MHQHSVCQRCIYRKLTDEGETCCPVCGVYLGADPVKKLRVDHILRGMREKLFPFKKEKVMTPKAETSTVNASVEEAADIEKMTLGSIYLEVKGKKYNAKRKASASRELNGKQIKTEGKEVGHSGNSGERDQE